MWPLAMVSRTNGVPMARSSTPSLTASLDGGSHGLPRQTLSSMRWNRPRMIDGLFRKADGCITRIAPLMVCFANHCRAAGRAISVHSIHRAIVDTQGDCRYIGRLAEAGIDPSVGSVGDSYDKALAETIDGVYKTELLHRQGQWRNMQDLEIATLGWPYGDARIADRLIGRLVQLPPAA
jgi:putative transposase